MNIICETTNPIIQEAARLVWKYHVDEDFLHDVAKIPTFNHTPFNGAAVAQQIQFQLPKQSITIKEFRPLYPWTKSIGRREGNTILLNKYKLGLPLGDRVENLYHECMHVIGFEHRGNYVDAYNLRTVPYQVGNMFAKYVMRIKDL